MSSTTRKCPICISRSNIRNQRGNMLTPRASRCKRYCLLSCGILTATLLLGACGRDERGVTCDDALTSAAVTDLSSFVSWLHDNHVRGAIGEVGWPATADTQDWNAIAIQWATIAREAHLPVFLWAASEWLPSSY